MLLELLQGIRFALYCIVDDCLVLALILRSDKALAQQVVIEDVFELLAVLDVLLDDPLQERLASLLDFSISILSEDLSSFHCIKPILHYLELARDFI